MRIKKAFGVFLLRTVPESDTGGEDVATSLRFRVRLPPGPFLRNADCRLRSFQNLVLPRQKESSFFLDRIKSLINQFIHLF